MKIAIIVPFANISGEGGINVQAKMWRDGLNKLGCECFLHSYWEKYDWKTVDYALIIGIGKVLIDYVRLLKRYPNIKIISAPIIDYNGSMFQFKLRTRYYGSLKLRFYKPYHDYYVCRNDFSFFLVRSEHEKRFLIEGMKIEEKRIFTVPISLRLPKEVVCKSKVEKENFCFHASRLADPGKNVARLIAAAKKYNFRLVLAGVLSGTQEDWLNSEIGNAPNIQHVGFLSDEELLDYYRRAKVFALPSLVEGVGMVALEAAVNGAEIVLTNWGAPKEYYDGRAILVGPLSVDSIGQGVIKAMNGFSQPELGEFIIHNYSHEHCSRLLYDVLNNNS